jgi:hypothetical protein
MTCVLAVALNQDFDSKLSLLGLPPILLWECYTEESRLQKTMSPENNYNIPFRDSLVENVNK